MPWFEPLQSSAMITGGSQSDDHRTQVIQNHTIHLIHGSPKVCVKLPGGVVVGGWGGGTSIADG